jgi:hypothetical protein
VQEQDHKPARAAQEKAARLADAQDEQYDSLKVQP